MTAHGASQVVGEWLGSEFTQADADGAITISEHIVKREAVLPSEFLRLPPVSGKQLESYYLSPHLGVSQAAFDYKERLRSMGNESAFDKRHCEDRYLEPWTEADRARIHFRAESDADPTVPFQTMPGGRLPINHKRCSHANM